MSHFTVLIAAKDDAELESLLAPFDENGKWFREGSHWDWWIIGGRWTGLLKLKDGHKGRLGEPGVMTDPCTDKTHADVALVKDVDWDSMIAEQLDSAMKKYDAMNEVPLPSESDLEKLKDPKRWESVDHDMFPSVETLAAYWYYERAMESVGYYMLDYDEIKELWLPREEYTAKQKASALTFAFVTTDGAWNEQGEMGWFGVKSNPNNDYDDQFWSWIRSLSPNQKVYVVDCHI